MIEKELSGALFIQPIARRQYEYGYCSRKEFSEQLKSGAVIGRFDQYGQFKVDPGVTKYYQSILPDIADALCRSRRDKKYRQYKIASIEKGSLNIHLEWHLEQIFNFKQFKFKFGKYAKQAMGFDVLLLDMHGPAYEVIVPMTIDPLMAKMNFSALRKFSHALRRKQKKCVNEDYKRLSSLTRSLSIFGYVCKDCPCLCKMETNNPAVSLEYASNISWIE